MRYLNNRTELTLPDAEPDDQSRRGPSQPIRTFLAAGVKTNDFAGLKESAIAAGLQSNSLRGCRLGPKMNLKGLLRRWRRAMTSHRQSGVIPNHCAIACRETHSLFKRLAIAGGGRPPLRDEGSVRAGCFASARVAKACKERAWA